MKRILLIQLRQLGDILLTTPCIKAIKAEKPDVHITFLAHSMGELILDQNPFLDEYFTYSEQDSFAEQLKLLKHLKEKEFDAVIDFMNNPRSALMAFSTRSKVRLGFPSRRSFAYTNTVDDRRKGDYIVRQKFQLLERLGFSPKEEGLLLPWFENHTKPCLQLLASDSALGKARLRVALSPTHRRELRRWPLERYATLAERLVKDFQAEIVWIWGPGEREVVEGCKEMTKVPTTICPETSFRELAALLANMDVFIGNSNGPSHVAVAADCPSIQLHGPTHLQSWCPMSAWHRGLQGSQGDIATIALDDVIGLFREMESLFVAAAKERRQKGPRLKWTF